MQNSGALKSGTILVLNGGSSSIKFSVYPDAEPLEMLLEGDVNGIGTPDPKLNVSAASNGSTAQTTPLNDPIQTFRDAIHQIMRILADRNIARPEAIGHRIVHSGPDLTAHQEITEDVLAKIEAAGQLAPLHAPIALELIRDAQQHFSDVKHYACFDTVFHQTMPESAWRYALPPEMQTHGVRRYGFHGLSCESILPQLESVARSTAGEFQRLVIAHLGAGASITAVRSGRSVHNTMGLTPCGGVVMGTRCGDLDPGLIMYLIRMMDASLDPVSKIETALNRASGLRGLSKLSGDMRTLHDAAAHGSQEAQLAIEIFVNSVAMAIGSYAALLGGLDALVFTGGIGEHDAAVREQICSHLCYAGLSLDNSANQRTSAWNGAIHAASSRVHVYVLPARENLTIAQHVIRIRSSQS